MNWCKVDWILIERFTKHKMKRRQIWKDRTALFLYIAEIKHWVVLTISKTGKENEEMGLNFYKMVSDFKSSWISWRWYTYISYESPLVVRSFSTPSYRRSEHRLSNTILCQFLLNVVELGPHAEKPSSSCFFSKFHLGVKKCFWNYLNVFWFK